MASVQRNGHLPKWPRLFMAAKSLLPLAALLAVAGTDVKAGEPVIVLASAKPVCISTKTFTATHILPTLESLKTPSANVKNPKPAPTATANVETALNAKTNIDSAQTNTVLTRENLLATVRENNSWVSLQAGYGRIWRDESILEKISAGHQEPGTAYVKAKFSF